MTIPEESKVTSYLPRRPTFVESFDLPFNEILVDDWSTQATIGSATSADGSSPDGRGEKAKNYRGRRSNTRHVPRGMPWPFNQSDLAAKRPENWTVRVWNRTKDSFKNLRQSRLG
jgi:hypothetical protein